MSSGFSNSEAKESAMNAGGLRRSNILGHSTVIDKYELGALLGIGTYGEVRVGTHMQSGEKVALKLVDLNRFRPEVAQFMTKEINILQKLSHVNCIGVITVLQDMPFRGTFCRECACTCCDPASDKDQCNSCQHPITVHTAPQERKLLVIVQELAAGGEMFGLLMNGGAFPEDICRYYFAQLLSALRHCHSKNVVHRDIKPENIVFDADFRLKLVDFGLAADVPAGSSAILPDGDVVLHSGVGSKPYSAPEVSYTRELYNATGYKGHPADIWSCAVVLFVMLTGRPPFVRPLHRSLNKDLVRCKHFVRVMRGDGYDGVPEEAKELLKKLFLLNPDERLTIDGIFAHPWMDTSKMPSQNSVVRYMLDRAQRMWQATGRVEMLQILNSHHVQKKNQELAEARAQAQAQALAQQQHKLVAPPALGPPTGALDGRISARGDDMASGPESDTMHAGSNSTPAPQGQSPSGLTMQLQQRAAAAGPAPPAYHGSPYITSAHPSSRVPISSPSHRAVNTANQDIEAMNLGPSTISSSVRRGPIVPFQPPLQSMASQRDDNLEPGDVEFDDGRPIAGSVTFSYHSTGSVIGSPLSPMHMFRADPHTPIRQGSLILDGNPLTTVQQSHFQQPSGLGAALMNIPPPNVGRGADMSARHFSPAELATSPMNTPMLTAVHGQGVAPGSSIGSAPGTPIPTLHQLHEQNGMGALALPPTVSSQSVHEVTHGLRSMPRVTGQGPTEEDE